MPALRWTFKWTRVSFKYGPAVQYYHFDSTDNRGDLLYNPEPLKPMTAPVLAR